MDINILTIILFVTILTSLAVLNNSDSMTKYLFIPYDVKHHGRYERFVTHMFIHGDLGHLAFNMFSLFFMGNVLLSPPGDYVIFGGLIPTYGLGNGQIHFAILYFAGGIIATTIPYLRHQDNMHYRSLGASGAVSAVVFAAILWNPAIELQFLFIPIQFKAWLFGIVYLVAEYYMDRRGGSGVAHDAHIGGAVFGVLYVLIINVDKGKEFFYTIFG